jgi:hypothetical protein
MNPGQAGRPLISASRNVVAPLRDHKTGVGPKEKMAINIEGLIILYTLANDAWRRIIGQYYCVIAALLQKFLLK